MWAGVTRGWVFCYIDDGTIFQCGPGSRDQGFLLGGAQAAVSWPSADCIKASSSTDAVDHNTHNMLLKFSRQELNHQALHRLKGGPRLINIKCCFSKHCTLAQCALGGQSCLSVYLCLCAYFCVHVCSCMCVYYKPLSCACSIWPRWDPLCVYGHLCPPILRQ